MTAPSKAYDIEKIALLGETSPDSGRGLSGDGRPALTS